MYLTSFRFPGEDNEFRFFLDKKRTCYSSVYPYQILTKHQLDFLEFEPVTILYGGNGSGKSTALNVIAEKLELERDTLYNRSAFFENYTDMCDYETAHFIPKESRIITSDDVFDYMLNLRTINEGIDLKREDLFIEYAQNKHAVLKVQSIEDYEQLKKINLARSRTQSRYVASNLMDNIRERSNGESAFLYFTEKIKENALYLLDEPENSLSPERQIELAEFLADSARFFGCQIIMATHSPFLLSIKGAKIYDLDANPVDVKRWTELENVRAYYEFFRQHEDEF